MDKNTEFVPPFVVDNVLIFNDGESVKLSLLEQLMFKTGLTTVDALDRKYNSEPRKGC